MKGLIEISMWSRHVIQKTYTYCLNNLNLIEFINSGGCLSISNKNWEDIYCSVLMFWREIEVCP